MFGMWQHLVVQLRLHYDILAAFCLFWITIIALLDYSHSVYGCDLLSWREELARVAEKPMVVMIVLVVVKGMFILVLTMLNYLKGKTQVEPPISEVKCRFSRFIMMRLLAAHDDFLSHADLELEELERRHAAFVKAVDQFRADARKIYEHNVMGQEMLPMEEREEAELMKRGYRCLPPLKEADVQRMMMALSLL